MYDIGNVVRIIDTNEIITIDEILKNGYEPLYGSNDVGFYHENELSLQSQTDVINNHINGDSYKIKYKIADNEEIFYLDYLKNTQVESVIDSLNKNKNITFFSVYRNNDALFYHTVFSGTYVYDETARQQQVTKNNRPMMVFGYNGVKKVRSKYKVWVYNAFDFTSGELDLDKILNIEGE